MKPVNGNHALLIGNAAAALESLDRLIPTDVEMLVDEDGDFQNQMRLTRGSGTYLVTIDVETVEND